MATLFMTAPPPATLSLACGVVVPMLILPSGRIRSLSGGVAEGVVPALTMSGWAFVAPRKLAAVASALPVSYQAISASLSQPDAG